MLELGAGADVLRGLGLAYIGLIVVLCTAALWYPKNWRQKAFSVATVVLFFVGPAYVRNANRNLIVNDQKSRYESAKALFAERCKTAGERIYRTATDVDGLLVMKSRTEGRNYADQYRLDDPYGYAGTGEDYLRLFVRGRPVRPTRIGDSIDYDDVVSYAFVEVERESGKGVFRYSTPMSAQESERIFRNGGGLVPMTKVELPVRASRYGITWDDISTREDRENWIAGSSQKIIDLQSNEVMAERIGYMFDRGQGATSGGRSPWDAARADACPPLNEKTLYFFDRVIAPMKGEKR